MLHHEYPERNHYRAGKMGRWRLFTFLPDAKFQKITDLKNPRRMP
jgi:hypothetical protein